MSSSLFVSASKCCWICINGDMINNRTSTLSLPADPSIMTRHFSADL
ncbi:hypothetical protein F3114_22630 [Citrobacter freundii]|nr:hypothetical protein F3113_22325 [Citrobacter freundii]QNC95828.1 hypothetical protein F3084_22165 [Citrobacter freundii]QND00975.1 hypothetical protein F3085_22365 [Citrobacter freundii]QND11395.1 hypothetical protein F3114_22630 [Citrobacter freundii]